MRPAFLLSLLLLGACASPALHQEDPWPGSDEEDLKRGAMRGDPSRPASGDPVPQPPR